MSYIFKFILIVSVSFIFIINPKKIVSKENSTDTIDKNFSSQSYSKDIRQLTLQYRGELEEYRRASQEYEILKQQYHKLGTLSSLEEAVRATQEAMIDRIKVLKTYLRLLRFYLLSQTGIELPEKQAAEQDLLDSLSKIEQHQQKLTEPLDKPKIAESVLEFNILFEKIESSVYRTLSLLAIGKLQTIHDKAIVLKQDMEFQIATSGGALKSAERKRAFDETDRVLNSLKIKFDQAEAVFTDPHGVDYKSVYKFNYDRLNTIYSSISRVLAFLGELLKI